MPARRSLKLPITLGVVMIVLIVALTVGWILLAVFGAMADPQTAGLYWALLTVGTIFLIAVLVGVVMYLVLSIKAVNLNQRQSNFIDSVTHELKSPIASLKLYLQTLGRRQVSEQEQAGFFRFMLEDVERLDDLVNHVLDAARVDQESGEDEIDVIDLADLLQNCAKTVCLRYRVDSQTVALELQSCNVQAPRGDLEMIFRNLIDNAVKYAGTPPQVHVSLRHGENQTAVTQIRDNGPGIPQPLRRKIFGRFVRLGLELERKQPGTGLGLHIVRTLVRRLRGKIRVDDVEDENTTGTIFEVRLPAAPPSCCPSDTAEKPTAAPQDHPGPPTTPSQEPLG